MSKGGSIFDFFDFRGVSQSDEQEVFPKAQIVESATDESLDYGEISVDEAQNFRLRTVQAEVLKLEAEVSKLQEEVASNKQDRVERLDYADRIYKLVYAWLITVFGVVFLVGISPTVLQFKIADDHILSNIEFRPKFELSDKVLLALIGGTTVSVVGLFVIVTNYLFDSSSKKDSP